MVWYIRSVVPIILIMTDEDTNNSARITTTTTTGEIIPSHLTYYSTHPFHPYFRLCIHSLVSSPRNRISQPPPKSRARLASEKTLGRSQDNSSVAESSKELGTNRETYSRISASPSARYSQSCLSRPAHLTTLWTG